MSLSTSIRTAVDSTLEKLGSDVSVYSYSSATKTTNDEGDVTVSNWGTATTIKGVSSNHYAFRKLFDRLGIESNEGERVLIIKSSATVLKLDKIIIDTKVYEVKEVKTIDPIQNTSMAQRIVLDKNERYV